MNKVVVIALLVLSIVSPALAVGPAATLDDITVGMGYYVQPSTDTGGGALTARIPYGTLPRLYPFLPQRIVDRLYYTLGGRFFSAGPGQQPPDGLFLTGFGLKLHEVLGISTGASHYLRGEHLTTMWYFAAEVDTRIIGQIFSRSLTERIIGP